MALGKGFKNEYIPYMVEAIPYMVYIAKIHVIIRGGTWDLEGVD